MTDTGPTPEIVKRGPPRPTNGPPVRSEQPGAARPDVRAQGERIDDREPTRDPPRLQRRFKTNDDKYATPLDIKPDDQDWNWKRWSVAGKTDEFVAFYQAELRANHWQPVMAEDYPSIAPFGQTTGPIVNGALMLMWRPMYLSEEARAEEIEAAVARVRSNANRIKDAPPGTFGRNVNGPDGRARIDNSIRKTTEIGRADDNMKGE